MAQGSDQKSEVVNVNNRSLLIRKCVLLMLRVLAFMATASATIVMGLNKETKTIVVANIGSTTISATLTAKFQHAPAFVFFVIANGVTSIHNLLMIGIDLCGQKLDVKGLRLPLIAILDMLNVALVAGGVGGASFMAQLGKNGNSHARWNKICDKFGTYCDHGAGALAVSFVGLFLMLVITILSIFKLLKTKPPHSSVLVP